LQILPQKLAAAGQADRFHRLLTDFDFIDAKISVFGSQSAIEDYDLTKNPDLLLFGERVDTLRLIQDAIQLSANILAEDNTQLAGQLLGRLMSYEVSDIQAMLEQAKQWKAVPWLRPLTPSLTPPGGPLLRTLTGHTFDVRAVAITPDGKLAVSASGDGTLKVWNLHTGEELRTLHGHTNAVMTVAISPDGKLAVSGSWDETVKIWDLHTGIEVSKIIRHNPRLEAVAITPDGKQAVSASNILKVWDLHTGAELLTLMGHTNWVRALAITRDGKKIISASEDRILAVWDLKSGEVITTFNGESALMCCAVTPDGVTILAGEASGRLHFLRLEGCSQQIL